MRLHRYTRTGTAVVVSLLGGCSRRPYGMGGGDWGHMMNYGYGGMIMWVLVLLLVVVAAYFLFARSRLDAPPRAEKETPLDILKKRYARGEISREEFTRMKADLEDQ